MLNSSSLRRIQDILKRIAMGKLVSLEERIYINKYASSNQNVSEWLRKASSLQQKEHLSHPIDDLLIGLNLCSSDPHSSYNLHDDDLGEWFSGAPEWIRRS